MSEHERIQKLNQRLREMERQQHEVPTWERPVLEVAREALLAELSVLAQSVARWDQMFRKPAVAGSC